MRHALGALVPVSMLRAAGPFAIRLYLHDTFTVRQVTELARPLVFVRPPANSPASAAGPFAPILSAFVPSPRAGAEPLTGSPVELLREVRR